MLIGDDNDLIFTRLDLEPALRSMLMPPAATAPPAPPPGYVHEAVTSTMPKLPSVLRFFFTMPLCNASNTRSSDNCGK